MLHDGNLIECAWVTLQFGIFCACLDEDALLGVEIALVYLAYYVVDILI